MNEAGPEFTVILPIVRPPDFLPYAVRSVLAQTVSSFELVIVSDGAPMETVRRAEALAKADARIRVASFPKGERHGEEHRATVLRQALGRKVAHLGDDDLWFPDHLEVLGRLLETVDFGNVLQVRLLPDGTLRAPMAGHLRDRVCRERMRRRRWNFFGPTEAGYRMNAYQSLPYGWRPAPEGVYSDLHMWRQFLDQQGLRVGSTFAVTALKFGAKQWDGLAPGVLGAALKQYEARLASPSERMVLRRAGLDAVARTVGPRQLPRWVAETPRIGVRATRIRFGSASRRRARRIADRTDRRGS